MGVHAYLIDDDKDYSLLLQKELLEMKFIERVTYFSDGEQALASLVDLIEGRKPKSEFPQLIILDIHLAGESGIMILDRLKHCESTKNIPVILHTVSLDKNEFIESYKKGGAAFVQKQTNNEMLRQVLGQLRLTGKI